MNSSKKLNQKIDIFKSVLKYKFKGYSCLTGKKWGRKAFQNLHSDNDYTYSQKKWALKHGFYDYSVERYGITEQNYKDFFSDFECSFISPVNYVFEKWLSDRLTPSLILHEFAEFLPHEYCNIIKRDGRQIYIPLDDNNIESPDDVIDVVRRKGQAVLIPSSTDYYRSYLIKYDHGLFYVNGEETDSVGLKEIINKLNVYYLLRERVETTQAIKNLFDSEDVEFVFIINNNPNNKAEVLCSYADINKPITFKRKEWNEYKTNPEHIIIDQVTGSFFFLLNDKTLQGQVPNWQELCKVAQDIAAFMSEIEYMSVSLKLTDTGIKAVGFDRMPTMPSNIDSNSPLNIFLKEKADEKKQLKTPGINKRRLNSRLVRYLKRHCFRKGFSVYTLNSWLDTIKDDFLHTKVTTLKQKIWAWRRGFPSYRIAQYGLTEDNYHNFLSDYDYTWLNSMNNTYRKWANDRLTMRYVFEPIKKYLPEYYFFVCKRCGQVYIKKLPDCTVDGIEASIEGIIDLLKEKRKLAFKATAAAEESVFYKFEYVNKDIFINDKACSAEELENIICNQQISFVITEYIEIHSDVKKTYPNSDNTIRAIVLNEDCNNPKCVHAYLKIGTLDGGELCCNVDKDRGYFCGGELLKNNVFTSCEFHPDSSEKLEGYLPNWQSAIDGIVCVSKFIPQIEYMEYSIALTDEGFKILGINFHPPMFNYVSYPKDVKEFLNNKLKQKKERNNIVRRKITKMNTAFRWVLKYKFKGYSWRTCKKWGRKAYKNYNSNSGYTAVQKKWALRHGFLDYSIKKYGLTEQNYREFFSDFDYTLLDPINNAYEKWLSDRLTPNFILHDFKENMPELYCNIIMRDGEQVYIPIDGNYIKSADDIVNFIIEKGKALLLPSNADRNAASYLLEYYENRLYVNGEETEAKKLVDIIENLSIYYLLREKIDTSKDIKTLFGKEEVEFVFIITNDEFNDTHILCSYAEMDRPVTCNATEWSRYIRNPEQIIIDEKTGTFNQSVNDVYYCGEIPNWTELCDRAKTLCSFMSEIEYMSISLKVTDDGIKVVRYGRMPSMPNNVDSNSVLNNFLKEKAASKTHLKKNGDINIKRALTNKAVRFLKRHYFRKGFREYMITVWLDTVKNDLLHTKNTTLRQKIWAWRRGFPSYRIYQYGLTEENYKEVLSDYDYAWLNRINNSYQKWINDKLTMRYVLDPVKEYLPEYYFFVGKRNGQAFIKVLQDCVDDGVDADIDGILAILKDKKKLVFKPNAGTHGDGFYKIEYSGEEILVNEEVKTKEEFSDIICGQKSTYVITDYIEMHPELKKIYPGSVNTIRVMVLNEKCYQPEIVHCYMRIGSSKTGFTDNVGYGGICAYVDKEEGYFYDGETLNNHMFSPCKTHPDTGESIEGYLPNWQKVKKGIMDISLCMPQLEYLGYDIAITEDGFKVIEINIHQDLHKYVKYPEEVKTFFNNKLALKKQKYGIKEK